MNLQISTCHPVASQNAKIIIRKVFLCTPFPQNLAEEQYGLQISANKIGIVRKNGLYVR